MTGRSRHFQYWRDPLCLSATAAYGINRWLVPVSWQAAWWRGHFADVLMIPVGLPLWLWLECRLRWRDNDGMPRFHEIAFVFCMWSVAAELIAPRLLTRATGDIWDVVSYAGGALVAGLIWQHENAVTRPASLPTKDLDVAGSADATSPLARGSLDITR